jgi:hypothetical protein
MVYSGACVCKGLCQRHSGQMRFIRTVCRSTGFCAHAWLDARLFTQQYKCWLAHGAGVVQVCSRAADGMHAVLHLRTAVDHMLTIC